MLGLALQGSMRSSYLSPSPPISGRDISALAVIRRPSWSGAARTASYDGGSATAAGTQVSLTVCLSASLHDHVLYGAHDPTATQEHAGASPVLHVWSDRLGHYVAKGRHYVAGCQRSVICTYVSVYISSYDCGAPTLSLVSCTTGSHYIWTHLLTLLSGSNISPSCCSRATFRAATNRIIREYNLIWLCWCRLEMWGPQCRTAWILASLAALQPSTC